MIDKDQNYVWHPYTSLGIEKPNIVISSAKGVNLITDKNEVIIDAISSWWVNLHGHSNDYINKALSDQAAKLEHVIFAGFTHEPGIRLAERLIKILPGNQRKIFYSDNGSTAVEAGIKMALQYWYNQGIEKKKIIALEGAFHGDTFGAMAVGERGAFTKPFQSLLFDVSFCPFPKKEIEQETIKQFEILCRDKSVAAFIYEPLLQGAAGMRMYSPDTLDQLMKIAHQHDILCIADEVLTGFGRTGKLFASEYMTEKPDIICMSKGLTGGYLPMGATACNSRIVNQFNTSDKNKTFFHGHSYTGNPLCCTAGLASLDILESDDCRNRITKISELQVIFKERIQKYPSVKEVRTLGTIVAIELSTSEKTGYFNTLRDYLYEEFLKKGILLRPLGNIIYILPPYVITEKDLNTVYNAVEELIAKLNVKNPTF